MRFLHFQGLPHHTWTIWWLFSYEGMRIWGSPYEDMNYHGSKFSGLAPSYQDNSMMILIWDYEDPHIRILIWGYEDMMIPIWGYELSWFKMFRACPLIPGQFDDLIWWLSSYMRIWGSSYEDMRIWWSPYEDIKYHGSKLSGLAPSCKDSAAQTYFIFSSIIWLFILPPWWLLSERRQNY